MLNRLSTEIRRVIQAAERLGYTCRGVSPRELYRYMLGETVTGDTVTLEDIVRNRYLLLHEVVEVSELKKNGIPVDENTVTTCSPRILYQAHLTAAEYELKYALEEKDYRWVKVRLADLVEWLKDENMPSRLAWRCRSMIERYSRHLG